MICEEVIPFEQIPNELWLQFEDQELYGKKIDDVMAVLRESEGKDRVVIYLKKERMLKRLSENWAVDAGNGLTGQLASVLGAANVKVVPKALGAGKRQRA